MAKGSRVNLSTHHRWFCAYLDDGFESLLVDDAKSPAKTAQASVQDARSSQNPALAALKYLRNMTS